VNRFLWDECANEDVLSAWQNRERAVDVLTVHDAGLAQGDDDAILAWAGANDRVVITQDSDTLLGMAATRLRTGQDMAGVIALELRRMLPGTAAHELAIVSGACLPGELRGRIVFLPL
jgi:predicted nuclease of predicted toxin-antitoxin system